MDALRQEYKDWLLNTQASELEVYFLTEKQLDDYLDRTSLSVLADWAMFNKNYDLMNKLLDGLKSHTDDKDLRKLASDLDKFSAETDPYEHFDCYGSYNVCEQSYEDCLESLQSIHRRKGIAWWLKSLADNEDGIELERVKAAWLLERVNKL